MANLFDLIKTYSLDGWKLQEFSDGTPNPRRFSKEELEAIGECTVVKGNYSMAVKITLPAINKAAYISLDKAEVRSVGDVLDKNSLELAALVYVGDNPDVKVKEKLVIRVKEREAQSFKNPFGI